MDKEKNYLTLLGLVTRNFSLLEFVVSAFIWTLVGETKVGQAATAQLSFRRSLDLLGSLFKIRIQDPRKVSDLTTLLKEASHAEEQRNIIAHSAWFLDKNSETASTLKIIATKTKGLQVRSQDVTVKGLTDTVSSIEKAAGKLLNFMVETMVEIRRGQN